MKQLSAFLFFSVILAFQSATTNSAQNLPLRVHFIDVGQGDSTLIKASDGTTVLIDGGYDNGDAIAYLESLPDVEQIDAMIMSHPHADHIGGLVEVIQVYPVSAVWASGAIHTTGIFERFIDLIDEKHVPYYEAAPGDVITVGSLEFDVLYGKRSAPDLNNTSLVLRLQYGEVSFLFTGDAELEAENEMLRTVVQQLPSTVLKVGHHGSYTSSSPNFLAAVQPQIAVYSAGGTNSYGHPHQVTIDNLTAAGATIYGTKVDGTVIIETDGVAINIRTSQDTPVVNLTPAPQVISDATPVPTSTLLSRLVAGYDPLGPDRDCGHFTSHDDAQDFFIAAGGPERDPHRLDGDSDGEACESLPRRR